MNITRTEKEVIRYQRHQLAIINICCFVILHRMGWSADKIIERFNDATGIWQEVKEKHLSAFELLENETGIELALDGEKSYTEFGQLRFQEREVTPSQYIYSLQRRKRWIAPMILAVILIAFHRVDGWEYDELATFITEEDALRKEYGDSLPKYRQLMFDETGYTPKLWEG